MIVSDSLKDFTNNAFLMSILSSTCFIVAFSLVKSFSLVIMEYNLLNKEETALSLQVLANYVRIS